MASRVAEVKQQLEQSLYDRTKPWASVFDHVEARTGIKRLYAFVGVVAFVAIWLVFGYAAQLICNFIGFVYPAYCSMHALETKTKDDDTKWLTYWVTFASFSIFEYFSDILVGWFPIYWLFKCLFLIWCMSPSEYNGSMIIYRRFMRPMFLKHHASIDNTVQHLRDNVNSNTTVGGDNKSAKSD